MPDGSGRYDTNRIAPDGSLWVCLACGKTARDVYGPGVQNGWDAACMLNAVLVADEEITYDEGGLVFRIGPECTGDSACKAKSHIEGCFAI